MHQVSVDSLLTGLGQRIEEEVKALVKNLGLELGPMAKVAPSIISRSEAELFGCSTPRFVYRVGFNGEPGFVHIRRLNELSHTACVHEHSTDQYAESGPPLSPENLRGTIERTGQSGIADCLIPRPPRLPAKSYHLLAVNLAHAYGEATTGTKDGFFATPYVRNVAIGGGLCSQAVCFMATASLHKVATAMHGLAEITALAHRPFAEQILIKGLKSRQMQRYFSHVGLRMVVQRPYPDSVDHAQDQARLLEFEVALRAYCLSDMPVGIPVDLGRLSGYMAVGNPDRSNQSIYDNNGGLPEDIEKCDYSRRSSHCIKVVGCEIQSIGQGESLILFNDPGSHPMMFASVRQLAQAGQYDGNNQSVACVFWAITPEAVRLPLTDFLPLGASYHRHGLLWLAHHYRQFAHPGQYVGEKPSYVLAQITGCDRFHHTGQVEDVYHKPRINTYREALREFKLHVDKAHLHPMNHWVWIEFLRESVWIWDAETEPAEDNAHGCLIARVDLSNHRKIQIIFADEEIT